MGFHLRKHHIRTKSQFVMGHKRRTLFPNSRIISIRFLYRQKATFRFFRKKSPFLGKDTDFAFAPLYTLKDLIMGNAAIIQQTAGTAFDMWQKLAFTLVLIASFILLYQNKKFRNTVSNLRFYGRMSLTNYIAQSIIGAIIYFPFGLYLAPYCGYTVSLLIGFFTFLLQVKFCKWWLSKHKQGPLELIWHKWTWLGVNKQ